MSYLRNYEVARLFGVSQATVNKWIKSAKAKKIDLALYPRAGKHYIADTDANRALMQDLSEKRRKYRNSRAANPLSGVWRSTYRVMSGAEKRVVEVEHYMVMHQEDNRIVIESLPNTSDSYMMARFTLDGRIATGTYYSQNTDRIGTNSGLYYGAAQMILDNDQMALKGKGVGFGKNMEVKMSEWELTRIGQQR